MKIDLTCPVELWRYDLPTQEYPVCTLSLLNLTEKPVASILASFVCYDREGDELARHVERVQGLSGQPRQLFDMSVAVEEGVFAADMDFLIDKVWFDDGTVWRRGANSFTEYTPNNMPNNRKLEMLRYLAGDDAVGYPSDQGPLWLCVCGRANAANADVCCRCGRDKAAQFEHLTQSAVERVLHRREEQLERNAIEARETASRMEQAREQKIQRRRRARKRTLIIAATLIVLTAATYGVYHHGLPYLYYWQANQALENGELNDASARFDTMLDYRDSASLALECDYLTAVELLSGKTDASLENARAAFDALALETLPLPAKDDPEGKPQPGGYRDSARLSMKAQYLLAEQRLLQKEYENAIRLFEQISTYEDATARVEQAHYQWALSLEESGSLEAAREKYIALGSYGDCAQRAVDCLYTLAEQALSAADYKTAVSRYAELGDHLDSATRLKETQYLWGQALFAEHDYTQAADHFLLAGTYMDASLMAASCLYDPAVQLMSDGQFAEAAAMFEKIPGHMDSSALAHECYYHLGAKALDAGAYEQALTLLTEAEDHADAEDLRSECTYRPAKDALERQEYDRALELLAVIPGYKDADALVKDARFSIGVKRMDEQKYAEAIEIFRALADDDYPEASARLIEALYAQGIANIEAMSYEAALVSFTQTSGYKKTNDYIQQSRYGLAGQLMAQAQYERAEELLSQVGGYSDAAALLSECRYQRALSALAQGDTDAATTLFLELGDYKDAKEKRQDIVYERAEVLYAQGDYHAAGDQFASINGYRDAADRASACYEAIYGQSIRAADKAYSEKDYAAAVTALETIDLDTLPSVYKGAKQTYQEACYQEAERLYKAGRTYDAYGYYSRIPEYKDVPDLLTRFSYLILGNWVSTADAKRTAQFRADGTCTIDKVTYYFNVSSANRFALYTGETASDMSVTHSIVDLDSDKLTLQDRVTNRVVKYRRSY